jgi:hypothetical protein
MTIKIFILTFFVQAFTIRNPLLFECLIKSSILIGNQLKYFKKQMGFHYFNTLKISLCFCNKEGEEQLNIYLILSLKYSKPCDHEMFENNF